MKLSDTLRTDALIWWFYNAKRYAQSPFAGNPKIPWPELLWASVRINPGDQCWEWTKGRNKPGWYGHFKVNGKKKLVHRLVWELVNCEIPGNLRILHKCDNPICCRPDHLQIGTQTENIHDMEAKGRSYHPRGEEAGTAKLTEALVSSFRKRYQEGESFSSILEGCPVGRSSLWYALKGKTWSHVQ